MAHVAKCNSVLSLAVYGTQPQLPLASSKAFEEELAYEGIDDENALMATEQTAVSLLERAVAMKGVLASPNSKGFCLTKVG